MTDIVSLFCEVVQIDSPTGHEQQLAKFLVKWLAQNCHATAHIDEIGNVFVKQSGVGPAVFLCAHMDTVEPGRGIHPIIDGEWIHSDGTTILGADNKNSLAALLVALEWHSHQPENQRRPVEALFTVEEEANNTGAVQFDATQLHAKEGYIFDASIPVGTIISAAPFYARFDITIQGKSAHAGYRELAQPAVGPALKLITEIEALRSSETLINIGQLQGGTARNTVIGQIELHGEVRTYKKKLLDRACANLARLCENSDLPVDVEIVVENPGYIHSKRALRRVQQQFSSVLKKDVEIQTSYGCSDANIFNSTLPVYCCGSGELEPHTVRERVHIPDLHRLVKLYQSLITLR